MVIYKQIQASFWQNAFVLELTPEERYFYVYLITNTTTTACGIYRFNMKLAVLESGLSEDTIKKYLNAFENSGKIIISKMSQELMIVNWLKHNTKMNKRIIGNINAELKEIKDKELLRLFYDICKKREYPVEAIFNGVKLPKEQEIETDKEVKEVQDNIVQAVQETAKSQEKNEDGIQQMTAEEGKPHEIIEICDTYEEQDREQTVTMGTPTVVSTWTFNDSGGT